MERATSAKKLSEKKLDSEQRREILQEVLDTEASLTDEESSFLRNASISRDTVSLTIKASPDDWLMLLQLSKDPKYLGQLISINAIQPVFEDKIRPRLSPPPRGKHAVVTGTPEDKTKEEFMNASRNYVAAAHAVVEYWLIRPEEEWPESFKEIVASLPQEEIRFKGTHAIKITSLIWLLWKKEFERRGTKLGLSGPGTLKAFREEFIAQNLRFEEALLVLEKHKSDNGGEVPTIEELAVDLP